MSRFSVSRSTVAEDNVAIIDQAQDEFSESLEPASRNVAQSLSSATANLSHHMATSANAFSNEALGLIPPVQVKQAKRKRGSPFKKYGSTSNGNGNLPLCLRRLPSSILLIALGPTQSLSASRYSCSCTCSNCLSSIVL